MNKDFWEIVLLIKINWIKQKFLYKIGNKCNKDWENNNKI